MAYSGAALPWAGAGQFGTNVQSCQTVEDRRQRAGTAQFALGSGGPSPASQISALQRRAVSEMWIARQRDTGRDITTQHNIIRLRCGRTACAGQPQCNRVLRNRHCRSGSGKERLGGASPVRGSWAASPGRLPRSGRARQAGCRGGGGPTRPGVNALTGMVRRLFTLCCKIHRRTLSKTHGANGE